MSGLSREDIAAAREQGDLAALVLMSSGLTIKAPKQRTAPRVLSIPRARPGAWPDGTHSPGLTPEVAEHLAQLWPGRFSPSRTAGEQRFTGDGRRPIQLPDGRAATVVPSHDRPAQPGQEKP